MKALNVPRTGSAELDSDLETLLKSARADKKKLILQAIRNRDLTEEELRKSIPLSLMKIVYALIDETNFTSLLAQLPKKAHRQLKDARIFAKREFGDLIKHPAALRVLRREVRQDDDKPRLNLNIINRMSWMIEWVGKPPKLIPSVRVGFRDRRNNLLLDSSMDWDDALYLIEGMSSIVADQFEDGITLAKANLLNLSEAEEWTKKLRNIQVKLQRIIDLAPIYGIHLTSGGAQRENKARVADQN